MLSNPNMSLIEFAQKVGGITLTPIQIQMMTDLQQDFEKIIIHQPRHENLMQDGCTDITEVCVDCGNLFEPDGVTNFLGSPHGDTDCSPFTPITAWCSDCYPKHTQSCDDKRADFKDENSGTDWS